MNKNFKRNIIFAIMSIILFFSKWHMGSVFAKDSNDLYKEFFNELNLIDKDYHSLYVREVEIANFLNKIGCLELRDFKTLELIFDGDGRLQEHELKKSFLFALGYDVKHEFSPDEIQKIFNEITFENDMADVKRTSFYERLYSLLKIDLYRKDISLVKSLLDEGVIDTYSFYNLGFYKYKELIDGYKEKLYKINTPFEINDPIIIREIRKVASEQYITFNYGNKFRKSDLYFLKELTIFLNADDNVDFSVLNKLPELRTLTIESFHKNVDLSYIKELKNLNSFEIKAYELCNLDFVKDMTGLESLKICNQEISNEVYDLSFLREFKKLKVLKINGLNIRDVKPIGDLKQLISLDIGEVSNESIREISRLKNLIYLSIGGMRLKTSVSYQS